jgi:hypothetical protein
LSSRAGLIFFVAATALLRGQPISTDRPAVAESSTVVPKGSLQVENGFQITSDQGQSTLDGPETELRFGVASNTELRLSVPDYYHDAVTGFGDLAIGIKQQLGPAAGFDVSIIAFLSLPTGAAGISSHGYDPGLQLPWSRKLSTNWTAAGQLALYARNLTGQSTFLLDRQITSPMDAFIEYAGEFAQRGGPQHLLHLGVAYKITPHNQLDVHYGIGLSSAEVNHFIGIGYSFRIQAFGH